MRILLIYPYEPGTMMGGEFSFRLPPLGIMQIAGCTPDGHEVVLVDENVEPVDLEADADLVGFSVTTPNAHRTYAMARRFRERGIPVVFGGVHPTMMPEEAAEQSDAIVFGEGDRIWPQVVRDVEAGRLEREYRGPRNHTLAGLPRPRRDLIENKGYSPVHFVETTRGCPHACEFCSVTTFWGGRYRSRPLEEVMEELRSLKPLTEKRLALKNCVFFVDDNIGSDPEYAARLFEAITPLGLYWVGQASVEFSEDPGLLRLAARSGCRGLLVGLESVTPENLALCRKMESAERYREAIDRFHEAGIGVEGSFIVGFDHDQEKVFDAIHSFTINAAVDSVYLSILTPYPGTRLHRRMEREGRLLSRDWRRYDTSHVVFQPDRLSPARLERGYIDLYRRAFSGWSIARRLTGASLRRLMFFLPMNFGFRRAIYSCDPRRFGHECEVRT